MFETSAVRDLVWALESPPMFNHRTAVPAEWGVLEVLRNRGLLARLDQPNSVLQKAVSRRRTNRLGEYFEILLRTWLEEIPPARLLGAGVQVNGSSGTVGEFDLVFSRDSAVHHWELAVKYYLGFPERNGPAWYGPDPRDALNDKWKKLRRQQLRLSEHPEGRRALRRLGVNGTVHGRAFVKGYLFEPLNENFATHDHPHANAEVGRGWWVHRDDLGRNSPAVEDDVRWLRLGRLRWMAPVVLEETDSLSELGALVGRLPADDSHLMAGFAMRDGQMVEVSRGFVVPERWPR